MRLICFGAAGVTGYLAITALRASDVVGCGGGEVWDCGHVLSSRWSKVLGLPVSIPAFALYAATLVGLCIVSMSASASLRRLAWGGVTIAAIAAGLAAVWFIGLQTLEVRHLCLYCMLAHSCGLMLCIAMLWKRPLGTRTTLMLAMISTAGVGTLIAGQTLVEPAPTFKIERYPADNVPQEQMSPLNPPQTGSDSETPAQIDEVEIFEPFGAINGNPLDRTAVKSFVPATKTALRHASAGPVVLLLFVLTLLAGTARADESVAKGDSIVTSESAATDAETDASDEAESDASAKDASEESTSQSASSTEGKPTSETKERERRLITVSGGQTTLDVRQWPLLGDPEAKYIFVEMFDYTCPHCRATHFAIEGAMKEFGDDLAVVALPVPLDRACNDAASGGSQHQHSCELSRIAVTVWRVQPKQYRPFHAWLFQPQQGRTPGEARRYAAQLVGEEAFNEEESLPYAGKYIAKHVELYKRAGAGSVPKLLFPNATLVGEVGSVRTLSDLVKREAGTP